MKSSDVTRFGLHIAIPTQFPRDYPLEPQDAREIAAQERSILWQHSCRQCPVTGCIFKRSGKPESHSATLRPVDVYGQPTRQYYAHIQTAILATDTNGRPIYDATRAAQALRQQYSVRRCRGVSA